ncbi:hypothetical protein [Amycolatopsis suaedae]|uniref:Uncharacterized protein n=1 Tax=Amycolatopsis suaedae TaxID=2510978 RepID=A0A4Q7J8J7_9PSEU|nr:hypothetical protein [Amycolatopsis suaedae]RZQ63172.1 hypothetical protein EWH70_15965 [Amycolatopsis suaedae]
MHDTPPANRARMLAAALAAVAAGLLIFGTFLSHTDFRASVGSENEMRSVTSWTTTSVPADTEPLGSQAAQFGLPLTVVGALLLVGALAGALAASPLAGRGVLAVARTTIVAGAAAAGAAVWMLAQAVSSQVSFYEALEQVADADFEAAAGPGLWVPVGAVAVAAVAAVLTFLPDRTRRPRPEVSIVALPPE